MEPKRLDPKDYNKVKKILIEYYNARPDEYGLMERPEEVYKEYAEFISKYIDKEDAVLLDVGCGSWRIPQAISKYNFNKVYGLDFFSEEKLKEYQSHLKSDNVELISYKDENIPFPDATFDSVSSLCVVEHFVEVEHMLDEMDRVTKPGGKIIIHCPNWSGVNIGINALLHNLKGNKLKYWRLGSIKDSVSYIFRSFKWYFEVLFSKEPKFIRIYPNTLDNKLNFTQSDDDAVHLCQPLSFKKYFKKKGYEILVYNRGTGTTTYSKIFNYLFPSQATSNIIVVRKGN